MCRSVLSDMVLWSECTITAYYGVPLVGSICVPSPTLHIHMSYLCCLYLGRFTCHLCYSGPHFGRLTCPPSTSIPVPILVDSPVLLFQFPFHQTHLSFLYYYSDSHFIRLTCPSCTTIPIPITSDSPVLPVLLFRFPLHQTHLSSLYYYSGPHFGRLTCPTIPVPISSDSPVTPVLLFRFPFHQTHLSLQCSTSIVGCD